MSIPSNIAEGFGRGFVKEYVRFLRIAASSLYELQTQLEICSRLGYLDQKGFEVIFDSSREIERMLSSLTRKLEGKMG